MCIRDRRKQTVFHSVGKSDMQYPLQHLPPEPVFPKPAADLNGAVLPTADRQQNYGRHAPGNHRGKRYPCHVHAEAIDTYRISCHVNYIHQNRNRHWRSGIPGCPADARRRVKMCIRDRDYVFTVEMITDPACAASYKTEFDILTGVDSNGVRDTSEELGMVAVDEHTIQMTFDNPVDLDTMLYNDCNYYPIPKHLLEDVDPADYLTADLWSAPIGSGPVKFESTVAGTELVVTAYEDYHFCLLYTSPREEMEYIGPEGVCPVCHCDVVRVEPRTGATECALCGVKGRLLGGRVVVAPEEAKISHILNAGRRIHMEDLKNNGRVRAGLDQEEIRRRTEPLLEEIPLSRPAQR